MKKQKTYNSQTNIEEEKKVGGFILHNIKTYNKVMKIKMVWYWWKNRHIDQWNWIESPDIDTQTYSEQNFLITKAIQWKKNALNN